MHKRVSFVRKVEGLPGFAVPLVFDDEDRRGAAVRDLSAYAAEEPGGYAPCAAVAEDYEVGFLLAGGFYDLSGGAAFLEDGGRLEAGVALVEFGHGAG